MKRNLFIFIITTLLSGCNISDNEDISGYVMDKEDERILVVSTAPTSGSRQDKYFPAMWLNHAPHDVRIGDKVSVWYHPEYDISDSHPGGAVVGKLEKIKTKTPEEATLTESEALRKALLSDEIEEVGFSAATSIKYDNNSNKWHFEFNAISVEKEFEIQISDQ